MSDPTAAPLPKQSSFKFPCPHCGATIAVTGNVAGQTGRCRACKQKLIIPASASEMPPTPVSPGPPPTSTTELLKNSASLAAKQAQLKALELTELKAAYQALGEQAISAGLARGELASFYTSITQVDALIAEKRSPQPASADAHATLADKARQAALAAKERIALEGLLHKRKTLVISLGQAIHEQKLGQVQFQIETARVEAVLKQVVTLRAAITELENSGKTLRQHPLLKLVVVAAIAGVLYWPVSGAWRLVSGFWGRPDISTVQTGINDEAARIRKETAEMELQYQRDRQAALESDRIEKAKIEQERKKKEIESLQRREAELKRREDEKERQLLAAEDAQKKQADEQRAERARFEYEQSAQAKARGEYAARAFSTVPFKPDIILSRSVKASAATAGLVGKNWDKILDLHSKQQWLPLINLLLNQELNEMPDVDVIDRAVKKLMELPVSLLLTTKFRTTKDRQLYLLSFYPGKYNLMSLQSFWSLHPDGKGYLHAWEVKYHGAVILYGTEKEISSKTNSFNTMYLDQKKVLDKKLELGEITEQLHAERLFKLIMDIETQAVRWASTQ